MHQRFRYADDESTDEESRPSARNMCDRVPLWVLRDPGGTLMPEDEWLDVVAAAERHDCSTQTIWRRIRQGVLPPRSEKTAGRDGRPVIKSLIRVSDLNDAFGRTAQEEHVRRIRATAPPLSDAQKRAIAKVFLEHLQEREAKRETASAGGGSN